MQNVNLSCNANVSSDQQLTRLSIMFSLPGHCSAEEAGEIAPINLSAAKFVRYISSLVCSGVI